MVLKPIPSNNNRYERPKSNRTINIKGTILCLLKGFNRFVQPKHTRYAIKYIGTYAIIIDSIIRNTINNINIAIYFFNLENIFFIVLWPFLLLQYL